MNTPFFIAKRIASQKQTPFARFIIRLAIASIAISLSVMIITSALISGFQNQISQKVFGFWGHIHIMSSEVLRTLESVPIARDESFISNLMDISSEEINAYPRDGAFPVTGGIKHIQVFVNKPGIIQTKQTLEAILLKGVGPEYNWDFFDRYIDRGSSLNLTADSLNNGIIISNATALRLNLDVGDKFIIHFVKQNKQVKRRFTVSGIYKTGLMDYDKKIAIVDIRQLQGLNGWEEYEISGYELILDDLNDARDINEYIYYQYLPTEYYSETLIEKDPSLFQWIALQDKNRTVILALMMLVSVINLITMLLILILERTRMIGVLRSLGMTVWSVRNIFLIFAFRILIMGLLIGNVLGLGICLLQQKFGIVTLSEEDYYLRIAPIHISWLWVLSLNIGTIVIVSLCLILPTVLVSKIDPVKAIKFR